MKRKSAQGDEGGNENGVVETEAADAVDVVVLPVVVVVVVLVVVMVVVVTEPFAMLAISSSATRKLAAVA